MSQDARTLLSSMREALEAQLGSVENVSDGLEWRTDHGPQFTGGDARDLCDDWNVEHTFAPIPARSRTPAIMTWSRFFA